jgi:biotin carboxyl carrier protein
MNMHMHRLDPKLPDPVESRRRGAGRFVRFIYGAGVLGVIAFFVIRFGAPLVYLEGPGIVSANREVVSLPYTVQVTRVDVAPGARIGAGAPIAMVRAPQVRETVANLLRGLAEVSGREAELRVRARVARDTLDASHSRLRMADEALIRLEESARRESASLIYRGEVYRERAQAVQSVVSLEAEATEASAQLVRLSETHQQIQAQLDQAEREFDGGRVLAPVTGIVSTRLAKAGETIAAGSSIAEIYQSGAIYVDWYIPSFRLMDPKPGQRVLVVSGRNRITGEIEDILPISDWIDAKRTSVLKDPQSGQVARIRLDEGTKPLTLNATVAVHMYYLAATDRIARGVVDLLGLGKDGL